MFEWPLPGKAFVQLCVSENSFRAAALHPIAAIEMVES